MTVALAAQALRSMAMVHASTNFSHRVAFRKQGDHKLVTDGVYGCVSEPLVDLWLIAEAGGVVTHLTPASSTGHWARK